MKMRIKIMKICHRTLKMNNIIKIKTMMIMSLLKKLPKIWKII